MKRKIAIVAGLVIAAVMLLPAGGWPAMQGRDKALCQALYFALSQGDVNRVAALRDKGVDLDAALVDAGLEAALVFNYDNPDKHYRREINKILLTDADYTYWPVLNWAILLASDDELDSKGQPIEIKEYRVYPDRSVYEEIIRVLIKSGASLNAADRNGTMPLHWAAWSGNYPVVKALLENGANPYVLDNAGRSPLDWALMTGQADIVRLLPRYAFYGGPDSDGDGVPDSVDKCPHTPRGAPVDDRGCWIAAYAHFFDFNRAVVKRKYRPQLKRTAHVLKVNPDLIVELGGHTDSVGSDQYNQKLGLRRANAVRNILVKYGVNKNKLKVASYGENQPVATNDTAAGRAKNRRVEVRIWEPGAEGFQTMQQEVVVNPATQSQSLETTTQEVVVKEEVVSNQEVVIDENVMSNKWADVPDEQMITASEAVAVPAAAVTQEVIEELNK